MRGRLLPLILLAALLALSSSWAEDQELSIEQAVQLALERHERARAATLQVEAAEARVGRARAFFFPDLTLVGNYTRRASETVREVGGDRVTIQRRNALSPRATVRLTLFDARSLPLYRQASRERDAARLTAADDRRLLAFEAADAFLLTLGAGQVLEAARRRLELAGNSLADAQARFAAQLVSSNDVTRAELELAIARHEATRTQGEVEDARLQLGYLLDTPVEGALAPPVALLQIAAAPPGEAGPLIAAAQRDRPDLAAEQQRAAALDEAAQEPLRRLVPSLEMNGQYRMTNEGGLSGRDRDWSVGLDLTWNLYDGGALWAERTERRALARIAGLEAQAAQRRAALEVRTALVALASQQAAIDQAQVAAGVARENAAQTAELYRQGLASALAVADANARLFEAEVALVREQYGVALAYLDLRAALGLNPLEELNP